MAKKVAAAGPVEGRWALPDGWSWHRAQDIAKIVGGSTPKNAADTTNYSEDGTPWLTPADLSGYSRPTIDRGRRNLAPHVVSRSALLPAGAVLISSRAPVGYCAVASNPMVTNQGFRSLILADHLDPFFVRYYVLFSRKYLEDHASGTTFKELSGGALGDLVFPVPPLGVQRQIVARIDELFAEINDGEAALARARDNLATWRKALLKAAVTGELTADWRAANPYKETGADLLTRILADRRSEWAVEPANRGKRYKEPDAVSAVGLPNLPESWVWTNVDSILLSGIQNGLYLPQSSYGDGHPILRIDDFQSGTARPSTQLRLVSTDIETARAYALNKGDLIVNRVNSMTHLAKSFLVRDQHVPALFESNMMRMKPSKMLDLDYLEYYISSDIGRSRLCRNAKAAVNQASVNQTDVKTTPIPLPPLDEQNVIATRVRSLIAETEAGADNLATMSVYSATLRQSILAAAFRGELA